MADHAEYTRVMERYRAALYRYCYYRLKEDTLLTDPVVNEILTIAYRQWDTLDKEHIRAYLYRVADNCIKHAWKEYKEYHDRHTSWEEEIETHGFENEKHYDQYFKDETDVEVYMQQIRDRLPEDYQLIYEYRFIQKKTINEMVELTGIPYSSLRLRLDRIEQLVRREVKWIFEVSTV